MQRERVRLGRTELRVPDCGLGGIPVGKDRLSDAEASDLIRQAIDAGLTLIDTFSNYGRSEIRIGQALRGRRDEVTLVTKARSNFAPREFRKQVEGALGRLRVECIDVLLPLLDRFQHIRTDQTYRQQMQRSFAAIGADPDACRECRKCIEECPFKLPVPERLKEAFEALTVRA